MIGGKTGWARFKAVIIVVLAIACVGGAAGAYVYLSSTKRSGPRILSDGLVGIILDKVERNSTYPTEFKTLPGSPSPSPKEGYDYAVIYLTIAHIESGHIPLILQETKRNSTLVDNKGQQYMARQVVVKGIAWRYIDPHDLSKCKDPFAPEGSKWVFLFEIPKDAKPAKFTFVYPFQDSWEQTSIQWGNIDVELEK